MKLARSALRSIRLKGRLVPYRLRESDTARRCRVRVSPAGVEVIVPRGTKDARAAAFLRENASWLLEQVGHVDRLGTIRVLKAAEQADSILLRGQNVQVEVVREPSLRAYAIINRNGTALRVRVPNTGTVDSHRSLEAWLRRQARQDIAACLGERAVQMRVRPGRVYIMDQRTKWGGCSSRRNLSFNWRLVMAPPAVLDYIVVHELAHLIEPYHSSKFWLIVQSRCPNFETCRRWLRENQERLGIWR